MAARSVEDICNLALLYAGVNERIGSIDEASATAQACSTAYEETRRRVLSAFRWPFATKRTALSPYAGSAYDSAHAYAVGDLAQYGVNVYRSLAATNTNHQPDLTASAAWWAQVTRDGWAYTCPLPADALNLISIWQNATAGTASSPVVFSFPLPDTGMSLRNPRATGRVPFALENANDGTDAQVLLTDLDQPILKYVADVSSPSALPSTLVQALAWALSAPLVMGLRGDEKKAAACAAMAERMLGEAFVSTMRDMQSDVDPVSEFEAAREGLP